MPSGTCIVCGATNYPLSLGGPSICPSCDCGHSPNHREVQRLRRENAGLRFQLKLARGEEFTRDDVAALVLGTPSGNFRKIPEPPTSRPSW